MSEQNKVDTGDFSEELKKAVKIVYVRNIFEVMENSFEQKD